MAGKFRTQGRERRKGSVSKALSSSVRTVRKRENRREPLKPTPSLNSLLPLAPRPAAPVANAVARILEPYYSR